MTLPGWLQNRWVAVGGACLLGAAGGYAAGYYTLPTREEWRSVVSVQEHEVEKIVTVEKVVEVRGPVRTVTRVVERVVPGECGAPPVIVRDTETVEEEGSVTVTTDTGKTEDRELEKLGVTATEHVVVHDAPRLTLFATMGVAFTSTSLSDPLVGLGIAYRVVGPLVLVGHAEMALNLTAGSARAGLGIQF